MNTTTTTTRPRPRPAAPLIPPPHVVRDRLAAVCREARLLRRLLRLSRDGHDHADRPARAGEVAGV